MEWLSPPSTHLGILVFLDITYEEIRSQYLYVFFIAFYVIMGCKNDMSLLILAGGIFC